MKEDGSWTNNTELVEQMYQFSTKEEKQQYCVEYIRENKADFFNAEHLRKKASYNFANGNLGASAFLNVEQNDQTLIWEMFSPWAVITGEPASSAIVIWCPCMYFCGSECFSALEKLSEDRIRRRY